ncbi:MAG: hypothetical protein AAFV77_09340 [Planctomycetota bacterium]
MARRAKKGEAEFLAQCRALGAHWDAIDPTRIGLSEAGVDAFVANSDAARAAFVDAERAREAYEAALLRKRLAIADLRQSFGATTATIDAFAKATRDRGVYAIAQLDAPETPGRRPRPNAPQITSVTPLHYGPIELRYTPRGDRVFYEIERQVTPLDGPPGDWEFVASTGHRRWRDRRVPAGVRQIFYRVRARRTTGRTSAWSTAAGVSFGCEQPVALRPASAVGPPTTGSGRAA